MSVLELARRTYARLKAERNGPAHTCQAYDLNDQNDQSYSTHFGSPGPRQRYDHNDQSDKSSSDQFDSPGPSQRYDNNDQNDQRPPYVLVNTPAGLSTVAAALDNTGVVGVDVETTGLDPRQ